MGLTVLIALAGMVSASGQSGAQADAVCRDVEVPVQLAGRPERVYGRVCDPAGGPSAVLQLLVPGITYDHHYWDMPGFDGKYSYVRYAAAAGYSTFAIDRLGTGRSSRPDALNVTAMSDADVIHQVVQAVRAGQLEQCWGHVVTVGHSLGTVIAEQEAAVYRDVDGLIVTGWLNPPGIPQSLDLLARHGAATPDNGVPQSDSLPWYLTTTPGARSFFYAPGTYDPELLAVDEQYKQTDTLGEVATVTAPMFVEALSPISVPSLLVVGDADVFFCTPMEQSPCTARQALESQRWFFTPQAGLQAHVQPAAGHNIALSLTNRDGFDAMLDWLRATFPA
ncbi:alpha/beta hydrolase [Nocardia concava]|uniref:alpha/beta hydrolase n=1 Tax=Nocardia concava TaxID=257281 RepID=UPI000686881F|nr:alpha/beta fold hydrolase [Nocardia concava]